MQPSSDHMKITSDKFLPMLGKLPKHDFEELDAYVCNGNEWCVEYDAGTAGYSTYLDIPYEKLTYYVLKNKYNSFVDHYEKELKSKRNSAKKKAMNRSTQELSVADYEFLPPAEQDHWKIIHPNSYQNYASVSRYVRKTRYGGGAHKKMTRKVRRARRRGLSRRRV
jgi:hypothetical protein